MSDAGWTRLSLIIERQEKTHHCWASVVKGVLDFIHPENKMLQQDIASKILGDDNNKFLKPGEVMEHFSILRARVSGALTWLQIVSEIQNGYPIVARVDWAFGGGHLVAISAFSETGDLQINDPLYGPAIVSYTEFCDDYLKFGSWSHSYLVSK